MNELYTPSETRYAGMTYRRLGHSGLKLPGVSLGLWHNFGAITPTDTMRAMLRTAFDGGITHFDLANNYGPPYGEAERSFGALFRRDFRPFRDEMIISTKAGYDMWPGPYGDHGSRKYLLASLDQSLKRMGLEYVDIFYHHRPDPDTPLEETMGALASAVHSGKALYVGLSNYPADRLRDAAALLRELKTPCVIEQSSYSMLNRRPEQEGLLDELDRQHIGMIAFAPLQNGILTGKYLQGVPADSRAARDPRYLKPSALSEDTLARVRRLAPIAQARGQSLAQMALSWVLRSGVVTSALIGASRPEQITENIKALDALEFTQEELRMIDEACL